MGIAAHFENEDQGTATRRQPRRTLFLEAKGETATGDTAVTIHNISTTGLLLESPVGLAEGEAIDVELPHAGKTRARVVWVSGAFKGCAFDYALSQASVSAAQLRSRANGIADAAAAPAREQRTHTDPTLGARIQRLRKERGLTLSELARRMGVSKPTVWAWEQGKARPVEGRFAALGEVLGVEPTDLQPAGDDGQAREVVERARRQIAAAYHTSEDRVRIMVEL